MKPNPTMLAAQVALRRTILLFLFSGLVGSAGCSLPGAMHLRVRELPPDTPEGSLVLMRTDAARVLRVTQGRELQVGPNVQGVQVTCTPACTDLGPYPGQEDLLRFELSDDSVPVEVLLEHDDYESATFVVDAPGLARKVVVLLRPRSQP